MNRIENFFLGYKHIKSKERIFYASVGMITTFVSLIASFVVFFGVDFENIEKYMTHITLAVCWYMILLVGIGLVFIFIPRKGKDGSIIYEPNTTILAFFSPVTMASSFMTLRDHFFSYLKGENIFVVPALYGHSFGLFVSVVGLIYVVTNTIRIRDNLKKNLILYTLGFVFGYFAMTFIYPFIIRAYLYRNWFDVRIFNPPSDQPFPTNFRGFLNV